nr:hypothetical protein [uncultured Desulfobacter sp.]
MLVTHVDIEYENFIQKVNHNLNDCLNGLKEQVNNILSGLQSNTVHDFPVRIAIYGGEYSAYVAYSALKSINDLKIAGIISKYPPCIELSELPHGPVEESLDVDYVFVATSPRHYDVITKNIKASIRARGIIFMYRSWGIKSASICGGKLSNSNDSLIYLPVRIREWNDSHEYALPLPLNQTAVILIDIWDFDSKDCPYCPKLPNFLKTARKHDLVVIHSVHHTCDKNYKFIQKGSAKTFTVPDPELIEKDEWPPMLFKEKKGIFSHREKEQYFKSQLSGKKPPIGIHKCALPINRDKEYIESDCQAIHNILKKNEILYIIYIGGSTLQCLFFRPAGLWNMMHNKGYGCILMRDLTFHEELDIHGKAVDFKRCGIGICETMGGCSSDSSLFLKALMQKTSTPNI